MSTTDVPHEDKTWLRGWWIGYHYDSLRADQDPELRKEFTDRIHYHSKIFPCKHCIEHYQEYVRSHPPEKETSMFVYTWKFHNAVNVRLQKPTMDFDTYKKIYKVTGYKCASCGDTDTPATDGPAITTPRLKREFVFST